MKIGMYIFLCRKFSERLRLFLNVIGGALFEFFDTSQKGKARSASPASK